MTKQKIIKLLSLFQTLQPDINDGDESWYFKLTSNKDSLMIRYRKGAWQYTCNGTTLLYSGSGKLLMGYLSEYEEIKTKIRQNKIKKLKNIL